MVMNFLQNLDEQKPDMKSRYLNLEKMVKEARLKTKFKNLLTKSYHIPAAFAKLDYENKTKSVNFRFVAPKFSSISDSSVKVTDEDLRSYYNEFIYNYQQEDVRTIDYVVFEIKATAEDRQAIAEDVNKLYSEFQTTTDIATFINSVSDSRYDSAFKKQSELQPRIANQMMTAPIGTFIENEIYYIAKLVDRQSRPDSIKMSQILISYETAPA
jgi:peptidyl-prolyl cis-trans isomerase D